MGTLGDLLRNCLTCLSTSPVEALRASARARDQPCRNASHFCAGTQPALSKCFAFLRGRATSPVEMLRISARARNQPKKTVLTNMEKLSTSISFIEFFQPPAAAEGRRQ